MRRARGTGKPLQIAVDDVPGTTEAAPGLKGERHKPSYPIRDPFRCPTFTYVQLSR